jgi:hypothetical protein
MSWRIDDHPEGGLQITHLVAPRFTARWTTGAFPLEEVREGGFFWTDEGSGAEDAIHFYAFKWDVERMKDASFNRLIAEAVAEIEEYVTP